MIGLAAISSTTGRCISLWCAQVRLLAGTRIAAAIDIGLAIAKDAANADKVVLLLSDGDVDNADCKSLGPALGGTLLYGTLPAG